MSTSIQRPAAVLVIMILVSSISFSADKGPFGLGIILGEPTGVSLKYWTSDRNAVDGGVAWAFGNDGRFHLHADYLWHFDVHVADGERFLLYTGIGGRFAVGKGDAVVGARVPLGFLWEPRGAPIDVFAEVVPILDLAPATKFRGNGGIGVRFFFP